MKSRYWIGATFLVVAVFGASLWFYPELPDRIPTHWNAAGQPNRYGPRSAVFLMPAMMTLIVLFFRGLPWLSPRRFGVDKFQSTFLFIMVATTGMFAYIHVVMLWTILHPPLRMDRALLGGICVFLALLGNVMGKVRRNFWIGVRTPWTLADERVWDATHRLAGRVMVAGGLIGAAVAFAGGTKAAIWVLVATLLVPVVYSLVCYKRLNGAGDL